MISKQSMKQEKTRSTGNESSATVSFNPKAYLSQYRTLKLIVAAKERQLHELYGMYDAALSVDYTKAKVQEPRGDKTASIAVRVADMDRKISDDIKKALDLMGEIMIVIDEVENPLFRSILSLRYINGLTFDEISDEIEYERSWLVRLHGRALKEIHQTPKNT